MDINSSRVMQLASKYSMLGVAVILSVMTGIALYYSDVGITPSTYETPMATLSENIEEVNSVSQITLEEIIAKNKVKKEKLETIEEEIEYSTVSLGNSRTGEAFVLAEGVNGLAQTTYKVKYENDVEVEKTEVTKEVTKKPVSQVVSYGSSYALASRKGGKERTSAEAPVDGYSDVLTMRYTAYCLCSKCCGKSPSNPGYGVTASGYRIIPGNNDRVVAIDPSVIRLGSNVYVQSLDGKVDYGYAMAADTGGAIKGNRIDLYVDSHSEALKIGTGYVRVYVLD